ncbi:DUF1361 domain-containing protein [Candidatus Saccharibacteria bacterium]|nr:DUF1361 domain-containing protein [Candidatus Saccharibacteria bacterium]
MSKPLIKVFALFCSIYTVICLLTFYLTKHQLHLALVWNLFLAFLPLLFSSFAVRPKQNKWLTVTWMIFWLLFFPNAIYVFTDVIHLGELSFYGERFYEVSRVVYNRDFTIWLELITVISGVFLALMMGLLSLLNIHKFLARRTSKVKIWSLIIGVSLLSSLAVFIGRFLRFNSWDMVARPWNTVVKTIQNLDSFALGYILLTTFFTLFVYAIFYQLYRLAKKS